MRFQHESHAICVLSLHLPGLQPTVAMNRVRLAFTVGANRMEYAAMIESSVRDAVRPRHQRKAGQRIAGVGAAIPAAKQWHPAVLMAPVPGAYRTAQLRRGLQSLCAWVNADSLRAGRHEGRGNGLEG